MVGYCDADCAGSVDDRKNTYDGCFFHYKTFDMYQQKKNLLVKVQKLLVMFKKTYTNRRLLSSTIIPYTNDNFSFQYVIPTTIFQGFDKILVLY